ncbi:MAG: hypothetical protein CNLJKLNK_00836 [Holosporales bacterium]
MRSNIYYRIAFFIAQSVCVSHSPVFATALTQMENDMECLALASRINPNFFEYDYWLEKSETPFEKELLNSIFSNLTSDKLKKQFLTKFHILIDGYTFDNSHIIKLMSTFSQVPSHLQKPFTDIMQKAPFFLDPPLSDGRIFCELAMLLITTSPYYWHVFESCLSVFINYDLFFEIPVYVNPISQNLTFIEFFKFALITRVPSIPQSGDYRCRSISELNDCSLRTILKRDKGSGVAILNAMYAYLRTPKNEAFFEEQQVNNYVYQIFRNNTNMNAHFALEDIADEVRIPLPYFMGAHEYFLNQTIKEFFQIYANGYKAADIESFSASRFIPSFLLFNNYETLINNTVHEIFLTTTKENREFVIQTYLARHSSISREKFMGCIENYEIEIESMARRYFYDFCKMNTITPEHILDIQDQNNWKEKYATDPIKGCVLAFMEARTMFFSDPFGLEYFFHLMKLHIGHNQLH